MKSREEFTRPIQFVRCKELNLDTSATQLFEKPPCTIPPRVGREATTCSRCQPENDWAGGGTASTKLWESAPDIDKIAGWGIGSGSSFFFFTPLQHILHHSSAARVTCWKSVEQAKESAVRRYFTLATPTSSTAVCKVNVSRGGSSTAKYNTTNLIKHIQKHHAQEHAEFLQLNKTGTGDFCRCTSTRRRVSDGKLEDIGNNRKF